LGLFFVQSWLVNIYNILRRIPTFATDGLNASFDTINSEELIVDENLSEAPMLLELVILNNDIALHVLSYFNLWFINARM
jgi:hypothetical protein